MAHKISNVQIFRTQTYNWQKSFNFRPAFPVNRFLTFCCIIGSKKSDVQLITNLAFRVKQPLTHYTWEQINYRLEGKYQDDASGQEFYCWLLKTFTEGDFLNELLWLSPHSKSIKELKRKLQHFITKASILYTVIRTFLNLCATVQFVNFQLHV